MIANVFLVLYAHFKPIKQKSEQLLQLLSLMVISLSLMLATLIAMQKATAKISASEDEYDRRVFSYHRDTRQQYICYMHLGYPQVCVNLLCAVFYNS